tara:strand:+ start:372 stop:581 length:210 start_codon:yes stop_codon:yes gene_type:complete
MPKTQTQLIKYALTFLLSNLDEWVESDMQDFMGPLTSEELEGELVGAIEGFSDDQLLDDIRTTVTGILP